MRFALLLVFAATVFGQDCFRPLRFVRHISNPLFAITFGPHSVGILPLRFMRISQKRKAQCIAGEGSGALEKSLLNVRSARSHFQIVLWNPKIALLFTVCNSYWASVSIALNFLLSGKTEGRGLCWWEIIPCFVVAQRFCFSAPMERSVMNSVLKMGSGLSKKRPLCWNLG